MGEGEGGGHLGHSQTGFGHSVCICHITVSHMLCDPGRNVTGPFISSGMKGMMGGVILATVRRYTRWFRDGSMMVSNSSNSFRSFPGSF